MKCIRNACECTPFESIQIFLHTKCTGICPPFSPLFSHWMHMELFPFRKWVDSIYTDFYPLFSPVHTLQTLDVYGFLFPLNVQGIFPFSKAYRLNLHGSLSPLFSSSHSTNTECMRNFLSTLNAYRIFPVWKHRDCFKYWLHTDFFSVFSSSHSTNTECVREFDRKSSYLSGQLRYVQSCVCVVMCCVCSNIIAKVPICLGNCGMCSHVCV